MRIKHLILLLLIPFSEIKAIFYNSDLQIRAYLFTDKTKYLCNVLEDYSNMIILGVVFYFIAFLKHDLITKKICLFLFIVNALDFIFFGLMGNNLYWIKIFVSVLIYTFLCKRLNGFSVH